jgi:hypothetical protein
MLPINVPCPGITDLEAGTHGFSRVSFATVMTRLKPHVPSPVISWTLH